MWVHAMLTNVVAAACGLSLALCILMKRVLRPALPTVKSNFLGFDTISNYHSDPVQFIKRATAEHGEVFELRMLFSKTTWLRNPQLNKVYLEAREDVWSFGDGMGKFLNQIVDPKYWQHLRTFIGSLSRGTTRTEILTHYQKLVNAEALESTKAWEDEDSVELFGAISYLMHRVIVKCLMGEDFFELHVDELFDLLHEMEANLGNIWNFLLPHWVPHPAARKLWAARDRIHEIFNERMEARALDSERWKDSKDYIAYTLQDQATKHLQYLYGGHHTVIMFAAHTSVVSLIGWTLIELFQSPIHLGALRDSLDQSDKPVDSQYLDAVLKETMRHYSAIADVRLAKRANTIRTVIGVPNPIFTMTVPPLSSSLTKATIPAGRLVSISPYLTHHDPSLYTSPDEWDPRRWLDDPFLRKKVNNEQQIGYMPFGAGSHRCPGEKLAWMMASTVVSAVLQNYDLILDQSRSPFSTNMLDFSKIGSPWLKGGIRVKLRRRIKQ